MNMFDGKVHGVKVSDYGIEHGYLDYYALSRIIGDPILNNNIYEETFLDWEVVNGEIDYNEDEYLEIYQYYIISDYGYSFLSRNTDEIVFYNEKLDMYLWGITHFGTSWDYVLTDIKLLEVD